LDKIIYKNFSHLSKYEETNHTPKHIREILNSKDTKIIMITIDNKIISYMIVQNLQVRGRRVAFLYYIYTSNEYRGRGVASDLLKYLEEYTYNNKLDGIMLTCDTKKREYDWYMLKGYMPDIIYRTYARFESLYKSIN
jgi:ribosomal protein S18 acetylase RimI-like enzyme